MRPRAIAMLAIAGVATALATSPAMADDDADRARAGEHVRRGDAFKQKGDYARAAAEYRAAYALVPHPELDFNLGQVHRLAGQRAEAIEAYRRYLRAEPDGRAADEARRHLAAFGAAEDGEGAGGGEANGAGGGEASGEGDGEGGDVVVVPVAGADDEPGPRPGRALRWTGLAAGAVGLGSLAYGALSGLEARSISDEISGHDGAWTDELLARQADGEAAERRMWIFTGVGAGLVVAGGVLYYLGHRAGAAREPSLVVAPWLGVELGGLALGGAF